MPNPFTEEWLSERHGRIFGPGPNAPMPVKPKKRRKVTSEAEIARVCTQVLIHDGWRHLKTDPVSRRAHGKGFGEVGMADALFIRYSPAGPLGTNPRQRADVAWIEWKNEGGGVVADHQRKWHADERAKGALTLIAGVDFPASAEGFMEWYSKSGLKRREASA